MTQADVAQDLLQQIHQRLDLARRTAAERVRRFDGRDLDEESEDSLRDLATDLRQDLHHVQGLLEEVISQHLPALRGTVTSPATPPER